MHRIIKIIINTDNSESNGMSYYQDERQNKNTITELKEFVGQ